MEHKLEDICNFYNGGAWSESEYVESGIPVVKVSNIKGNDIVFDNINYISESSLKKYQKNILKTDDVVIATVGSHPSLESSAAGRSVIIPKKIDGYLLNQNAVCLRTKNNDILNQKYLGYLAETQAFRNFIQNRGGGAANQMRIPIGAIKSYKFKIPKEQNKIVKILSNYDDLIENNLKQIKLLEEKARLTYEEWFLRFRIDGKKLEIDEETELPFGWEKKKIKDFGDVITGKTPSTANQNFYNGDIPFVKTPDMHTFPYVLETNEYLTTLGANSQKNKFLPKNSLMVSCIGSAGVYSLVAFDCQTNQQINSIKFHKEEYVYYMYCFAESLKNILDFIGSNGATMTNVNKTKFENIEVVMPEFNILGKYHSEVKNNFEVILNLQKQNQLLKESRDILLPRLMTGLIDVENINIEV